MEKRQEKKGYVRDKNKETGRKRKKEKYDPFLELDLGYNNVDPSILLKLLFHLNEVQPSGNFCAS